MLLVAVGACGSSTAAARARCGPISAHTLAADAGVRVYLKAGTVYGCSSRTRHVTRLGTSSSCIRAQRAGPFAVAGQLVAYGVESCGVDTGSSEVLVRRLSDGKVMLARAAMTGFLGPEAYSSVTAIVVRADGAVAWIGSGSSIIRHSREIEVHDAKGSFARLLDSGASIAPRSLRLHHERLTWRHGSTSRSATLS